MLMVEQRPEDTANPPVDESNVVLAVMSLPHFINENGQCRQRRA
jgi:hypothetical protein